MPGPSEKKTRQELIDPELKKAGWDVTNPEQVGLEIPVDGFDPAAWQQLHQQIKRLREAAPALLLELSNEYDVLLMNPPFKGAVDKDDVSSSLPSGVTKSELLSVHLILRALDMGGRAGVIVPDGVLFGSSRAHVELRQRLVEQNRLDGVVSMPGGVFKPYAGLSTAVLFFTKSAATECIWFYDMAHDGFSLDDKRQPTAENDIQDILSCWRQRHGPAFAAARAARLAELEGAVAPHKATRLRLEAAQHRLRFESVISADGEAQIHRDLQAAQAELAQVQAQVRANGYDLTASRYRQVAQDEAFFEAPEVTLEKLLLLDRVIADEVRELQKLLS